MSVTEGPLLVGRSLSKVYGRAPALAGVDFTLRAGEVRALIGSNGAGKSTLVKILTGATTPSSGSVTLAGESVPLGDPQQMIRRGIACIYQHSNLAPAMSVLDNLYLGRAPTRRAGFVDVKRQRSEALSLLARHRIELDLDAPVASLPAVKQKEVEILKALALDARVLLMDEPTGWLSAADVVRLHQTIRALKSRGVAVVYISHMLDEIFAVCDTMTILRDGRVIADTSVAQMTRARVVQLMVGDQLARDAAAVSGAARHPRGNGEVRLRARGLGQRGVFSDVDLDVHAGEILCLTGLIGSKRTELLHCLFGSARFDTGTLEVDGEPVAFTGPRHAMAAGIGFVPEDRHREGLMLGLPVSDNLLMATLRQVSRCGCLDRARVSAATRESIQRMNVQPPDGRKLVRLLSGGNQQKVLLGKWFRLGPRVILLDEPTVGVDVGAKAEIYALLRAQRDAGAAVLVVSSDLEEVMAIADRIAVMVSGRLVFAHDAGAVTQAQVAHEIGGAAQGIVT